MAEAFVASRPTSSGGASTGLEDRDRGASREIAETAGSRGAAGPRGRRSELIAVQAQAGAELQIARPADPAEPARFAAAGPQHRVRAVRVAVPGGPPGAGPRPAPAAGQRPAELSQVLGIPCSPGSRSSAAGSAGATTSAKWSSTRRTRRCARPSELERPAAGGHVILVTSASARRGQDHCDRAAGSIARACGDANPPGLGRPALARAPPRVRPARRAGAERSPAPGRARRGQRSPAARPSPR